MARIGPAEAAARWSQGASQNANRYGEGVARVTTAPGQQAAAKQQKMLQNVTAAIQSGKWASRVGAVSLGSWQASVAEKGVARFAQGAQAAEGKMAAAMSQVLPAVYAAADEVNNMPDLTLEDRINKSSAFQRKMAKFQRR